MKDVTGRAAKAGMVSGLIVSLLTAMACLSPAAEAGSISLNRIGGNYTYEVPIRTIREAKFQRIIRQQYDFSCGSAAVATLLSYHYDQPVSEVDVFSTMFETGDQDRIRRLGFSLLDMKKYLQQNGFRADGFKITLERIIEIGVPAIALIEAGGYRHFVVVKGVDDRLVLLGDPSRGTRTVTREEFKELWNGIALIIRDKASVGKANFNKKEDWSGVAHAPYGTALNRQTLSSFSVHLKNTLSNTF